MSDTQTQDHQTHPDAGGTGGPQGGGLPLGRLSDETRDGASGGNDGKPRDGEQILNDAAAGRRLSVQEADDLLDYFLANKELPGDSKIARAEVELDGSKYLFELRPIDWDTYNASREAATTRKGDEEIFDTLTNAAWNVAASIRREKFATAAEEYKRTSADLLRDMFSKQSGTLLALNTEVLKLSRLNEGNTGVRLVHAGKD